MPSADASTINISDVPDRRGAPITQQFLAEDGDNVSMVATTAGVSCVASAVIPITESRYVGADGQFLPFSEITRSKASSLQAIARPGEEASFRVQLKYSPDPDAPITLDIGGQNLDLRPALEPSRDSLLLTGPTARALEDALRDAVAVSLQATSVDTRREITDQIVAPDMGGFDTCLVQLEGLTTEEPLAARAVDTGAATDLREDLITDFLTVADSISVSVPETGQTFDLIQDDATTEHDTSVESALPVPRAGLRVEFEASPDPETQVTQSALEYCRMRDIPETLYLGRLTKLSGFFAQTQDVYVSFGADGQVERAYIPGIFDSDMRHGANSARVSLAADSNLPDQTNHVRGCLGDALLEAPVCVISDPNDDNIVLGECGVLGASDTREDPLPGLMTPQSSVLPVLTSTTTQNSSSSRPPAGGGIGGGTSLPRFEFDGTADDDFSRSGISTSNNLGDDDSSVPAVPLPAAGWLLLAGLGALHLLRRKAARRP